MSQKRRIQRARKRKTEKATRAQSFLKEQNSNLQGSLLNIRQMYDQATMEKEQLRAQLTQVQQLLTALVAAHGSGMAFVSKELMERVVAREIIGINVDPKDEGVYLTALYAEDEVEEDES